MSEKQSKHSTALTGRGGKRPGAGRPKGSLDKGNALIRDMVAAALHQVGGVDYLARQAEEHPGPFMALIGKTMPIQVTGENGDPIKSEHKWTIELVRANVPANPS